MVKDLDSGFQLPRSKSQLHHLFMPWACYQIFLSLAFFFFPSLKMGMRIMFIGWVRWKT